MLTGEKWKICLKHRVFQFLLSFSCCLPWTRLVLSILDLLINTTTTTAASKKMTNIEMSQRVNRFVWQKKENEKLTSLWFGITSRQTHHVTVIIASMTNSSVQKSRQNSNDVYSFFFFFSSCHWISSVCVCIVYIQAICLPFFTLSFVLC